MDPRKILGVEPTATPEEIQRAYREKAKKHHPDLGGDGWAFQQVQDAYDALTDPKPSMNRAQDHGGKQDPPESARSMDRPRPDVTKVDKPKPEPDHNWQNLFFGQLPLQTETTSFILVNCLDIFVTYVLLRFGAIEANPIADYFMQKWNFAGAIVLKLGIVAFVAVIAQIVAIKKPKTARALLIVGSLIVGCVVVYSVLLFMKHYGGL